MNGMLEAAGLWLADFHLLAATLLAAVLLVQLLLRQPVQRMAVTKSTLAALIALAAFCALPGWSLVHLISAEAPPPTTPTLVAAPTAAPFVVEIKENIATFPVQPATAPATSVQPGSDTWASISWLAVVVGLYGCGSAAVVAWLAMGSLSAGRVRRRARWAAAELTQLLQQIVGAARTPQLLVSDQVETAAAMGVWRTRIILGQGLVQATLCNTSRHSLAAVLAHEWAHIRNGDLWTLALSRLLLVLLWAQPLYWLLRRRMRLDQETLADAAAVVVSGRVDYAEQLLGWAQHAAAVGPRGRAPRLAGAVGLWEGPSQLKMRVAALLDDKFMMFRECSLRWRVGSACAALMAAALLSLMTLQQAEPQASAAGQAAADAAKPAPSATDGGRATVDEIEQHLVLQR